MLFFLWTVALTKSISRLLIERYLLGKRGIVNLGSRLGRKVSVTPV